MSKTINIIDMSYINECSREDRDQLILSLTLTRWLSVVVPTKPIARNEKHRGFKGTKKKGSAGRGTKCKC